MGGDTSRAFQRIIPPAGIIKKIESEVFRVLGLGFVVGVELPLLVLRTCVFFDAWSCLRVLESWVLASSVLGLLLVSSYRYWF